MAMRGMKFFTVMLACSLISVAIMNYATAGQRQPRNAVLYYMEGDDGSYNPEYVVGCKPSYNDPDGDCIPGKEHMDYPVFKSIPETGFSCADYPFPGYFADVDTYCQVFHVCEPSKRQHSMLCPKGTIFNQEVLVCDWWFNVDCYRSPDLYDVNDYNRLEDVQYEYSIYDPKKNDYYDSDSYDGRIRRHDTIKSKSISPSTNQTIDEEIGLPANATGFGMPTEEAPEKNKFPSFSEMKAKRVKKMVDFTLKQPKQTPKLQL